MRLLLVCALATLAARAPAQLAPPRDGRAVLERMHHAFDGKWYRTLSFDQHNTAYDSTGHETTSEWHEYLEEPGFLRIDREPASGRSGAIVRRDSVYAFENGTLARARGYVQAFAILLSDVYAQPVERTAHLLDSLGVALDKVHTVRDGARDVVVVGASDGDTTSTQFWVDTGTWLVTRIIQRDPRAPTPATLDVHVLARATSVAVPVETELLFLQNGRPVWREQYRNLRLDAPFPATLFDPAHFVEMIGFTAPPASE